MHAKNMLGRPGFAHCYKHYAKRLFINKNKLMILWDKTYEEFNIKNEYGYYTVYIKDGIVDQDLSDIPKYPRLRFKTIKKVRLVFLMLC